MSVDTVPLMSDPSIRVTPLSARPRCRWGLWKASGLLSAPLKRSPQYVLEFPLPGIGVHFTVGEYSNMDVVRPCFEDQARLL